MSNLERNGGQKKVDVPPSLILAVDWQTQAELFKVEFDETGDPDYLQMSINADACAAEKQKLLREINLSGR